MHRWQSRRQEVEIVEFRQGGTMGLSDSAMEYETDDCQWEDQWTAAEIVSA